MLSKSVLSIVNFYTLLLFLCIQEILIIVQVLSAMTVYIETCMLHPRSYENHTGMSAFYTHLPLK